MRARLTACGVFGLALAVYLRTLAPSITWSNNGADSGDLVAAAFTGGIPHPPGYPLYTLLAQALIALPIGGIAYRVNLLSACSAAAAATVLFAVLRGWPAEDQRWRVPIAAAIALFWAYSPLVWSQATIAEVYALNACLTIAALAGLMLWAGVLLPEAEQARAIGQWIAASAIGLGLAHHPTILLLLPGGLVLLWGRTGLKQVLAALAVSIGIAVVFYLMLPLRAWRDPPINWGDPRTLSDLWWVVSSQVYRVNLFNLPPDAYAGRLSAWARMLFEQFGPLGVALGLWGVIESFRRARSVGLALSITFSLYSFFALGYATQDSTVYLIPAFLVYALWMGVGCADAVESLEIAAAATRAARFVPLVVGAIFLLPAANLALHFASQDLREDTQALAYGRQAFETMPSDALVVADGDRHILALWYYRYVEQPESRVLIVAPGLLTYRWYRESLRRHYPEWTWPAPWQGRWDTFLRELIDKNADRHAVFWTNDEPVFQQAFTFNPAGLLFRAYRKQKARDIH